MRILTKAEAESVTKYYSEILIGKPITPPGNSNPFPITSLEITKQKENQYTVHCLSKYIGNVWHVHIDEVIPKLDVLPLEEFLSNLD